MTTLVPNIQSVNWQISRTGFGQIAQGLEDIRQCIFNILTTSRGTDPLRPEFGTLIYQYLDKPVNFAAPKIVSEILDGVRLWEQRVIIRKIVHEVNTTGGITFKMSIDVLVLGESKDLLFQIDRINRPSDDGGTTAFTHGFSLGFQ